MSREVLHSLVDVVEEQEIDTIYRILIRFVPEEEPLPDEIESIRIAEEERARGEVYTDEEVWV